MTTRLTTSRCHSHFFIETSRSEDFKNNNESERRPSGRSFHSEDLKANQYDTTDEYFVARQQCRQVTVQIYGCGKQNSSSDIATVP